MENPRAQRVIEQAAALDAARTPHESIWDELGAMCLPRHGTVSDQKNTPTTGASNERGRIAQNFDGTALRACGTLATGQAARITPMGARWFVLRPPARMKDNQAALNWYAQCSETLLSYLGNSNFYNRMFECYQHRGAYGCSALETTSGAKGKGLHFRTHPVGSYSIAENSLDEVDTISRTFFLSPSQMLAMFGAEQLPEAVRKAVEDVQKKHAKTERVIHLVEPRGDRDPRKADPENKAIASLHVHVDSKTLLLESGFDSCPMAVSRWQTSTLSPYGWGPADYALPEAAQANFQEQMLDVLAELSAYPRVLYPAGMKDEIDFGPLGLTSFDPNGGETGMPREWLTGGRYDIAKDRAQDKHRAIESAFFVELFQAVSRLPSDATAEQVRAIVGESREMFHPIFSNLTREKTTPTLRRAWQLLMMQGVMPPPPASVLDGDDLGAFIADPDVEYVSAMALALEQSQLGEINQIIGTIAPLAAADPRWLRSLNPDTIVPHLVRVAGLPTSFLRTEKELAAMDAADAQAMQAQQALAATEGVRNLGGVDEAAKGVRMVS